MKTFSVNLFITLLVLGGLALVIPSAAMWEALQIQAGITGNTAPITTAAVKMGGGVICLALAWFSLRATRNQ